MFILQLGIYVQLIVFDIKSLFGYTPSISGISEYVLMKISDSV